jgi:hypothetical protein
MDATARGSSAGLYSPLRTQPYVAPHVNGSGGSAGASAFRPVPAAAPSRRRGSVVVVSGGDGAATGDNAQTSSSLEPSAHLEDIAQELSISEESFWRQSVQQRLQGHIPRQRKFAPFVPGVPHTLHVSRFQRTGPQPAVQHPRKDFAALRSKRLATHSNCCGIMGATHASTRIALAMMESPSGGLQVEGGLDAAPLLAGVSLITALQTSQDAERKAKEHADEDVEWERRHWLNEALSRRQAAFEATQRLASKAVWAAEEGISGGLTRRPWPTSSSSSHPMRPCPPGTRRIPPWRYVDPLHPEAASTLPHVDLPDTTGGSLVRPPPHTLYSTRSRQAFHGAIRGDASSTHDDRGPVQVRAVTSVFEFGGTDSGAGSGAAEDREGREGGERFTDSFVSVATGLGSPSQWRAPARPGPDRERASVLAARAGLSQWSHAPVGANPAQGRSAVRLHAPLEAAGLRSLLAVSSPLKVDALGLGGSGYA